MKDIKVFVWDMDGVIYRFGEPFWHACRMSAATLAMEYIPGTTLERALEMSKESWDKYHSSYDFLHKDYQLDQETLVQRFHENLNIDFIPPLSNDFFQAMDACKVKHVVLTQGSRPWAHRIMKKTTAEKVFTDNDIITIEDFPTFKKATHVEPFLMACKKAGCTPHEAVMIEDFKKNLVFSKRTGMTTTLVHSDEEKDEHVDHHFDTPIDFMRYFAAEKQQLS